VDAGTLWFLITGGEPLLRPDFLTVHRYAIQKGLLVTFFTNGTLLTPQIADQLAELRPRSIEITLYGATRETYQRITGIPGAYDRCLQGIELLVQRNLPLKLKTMALKGNYHEIEAMKAMAEERGVGFRYDPLLVGGLDGDPKISGQRLTPQEVVQIDVADPERLAEWQAMYARISAEKVVHNQVYACGAGKNTFHIDPGGRLSPCILSRSEWYNLAEGSFSQGWQHLDPVVSHPRRQDSPCYSCRLMNLCSQCPGKASLEGVQVDQIVDYFCLVGHLRADIFQKARLSIHSDIAEQNP
jgi:radical SAM protein with 4Fe4S-binding SPASM domain